MSGKRSGVTLGSLRLGVSLEEAGEDIDRALSSDADAALNGHCDVITDDVMKATKLVIPLQFV